MEFLVCIQRTGNMAELLFSLAGGVYQIPEAAVCAVRDYSVYLHAKQIYSGYG